MDPKLMGEVIARIDERTEIMSKRQDEEIKAREKLDGRVSSLETWQSRLAGAWATLTIIAGIIGYAIKAKASK